MAERRMFIYKIICLKTNKIYIGRTTKEIKKRLLEHFAESKYVLNNTPLHADMKKFSRCDFIIEKIHEFYTENYSYADTVEREFIEAENAWHPVGYNVRRVG